MSGGEQDRSGGGEVRNRVVGGDARHIVQAGSISGGVHFHHGRGGGEGEGDGRGGADRDDAAHPVIATVHLAGNAPRVVVDADPPHAMAPSGQTYVVTLEAGTTRAVVLQRIRPVVLSRRPARSACAGVRVRRALTPRRFTAELDATPPRLDAAGPDFPYTISAAEVEQFRFEAVTRTEEVGWRLELDWTCAGRNGTTLIDDRGAPFETYPLAVLSPRGGDPDLDSGCGFAHTPNCPALRLAALSTQGTVKWFAAGRGIGAVVPDNGGADLPISRTAVRPDDIPVLRPGQPVCYAVNPAPTGPEAVDVRLMNPGAEGARAVATPSLP